MAEMAWEKPASLKEKTKAKPSNGRWKFMVGGVLLLGAVLYLVFSGTMVGARYFITVEEVLDDSAYVGQTVRLTGAVIGNTIDYTATTGELNFTIAHIPQQYDDLATVLHEVANDPAATRLQIHMDEETKPDLLQHEAQAIITGTMGEDGVFYATELLLKCPSRFQEKTPGNLIHLTPDAGQ
jgi:cytochrome c-type biogenesis protein CcmE